MQILRALYRCFHASNCCCVVLLSLILLLWLLHVCVSGCATFLCTYVRTYVRNGSHMIALQRLTVLLDYALAAACNRWMCLDVESAAMAGLPVMAWAAALLLGHSAELSEFIGMQTCSGNEHPTSFR